MEKRADVDSNDDGRDDEREERGMLLQQWKFESLPPSNLPLSPSLLAAACVPKISVSLVTLFIWTERKRSFM